MLTFLFWNLDRQPIPGLVAELAHSHNVDVLMLAECAIPAPDLLRELNHKQVQRYSPPDARSQCDRIVIYPRFATRFLDVVLESGKGTFRHVCTPANQSVLLGVVHLSSKLHQSGPSQAQAATGFRFLVERAEQMVGHTRTVLVGDWNMDPFEEGMAGAAGLHAVMTRALTNQVTRTVDGEAYRFFYNPMWGRFGDTTPGPPGSYYYRSSEHVGYFWHLFNQVLIRPDVLPFFRHTELAILDRIGSTSLLTANGLPDRAVASDHLPLLFRLHL